MANSPSSRKRIRQNEKRRARNRWRLRIMRETVKDFLDKVAHGSGDDAKAALAKCISVIDRTAQKGVIHKNQAARRKSRLVAQLKAKKAA
ncbi:MAG: 30S ribosomal protein S20 [Phycisphaerales bacterium]